MFRIFSLLVFTIVCSLAQAQETDAWRLFEDSLGQFNVLAPGVLAERVDSAQTEVGPLVYHTFYHTTQSDGLVYMVSYCDYPQGTFHPDSLELMQLFFMASMEEAVVTVQGKLQYSGDIKLNAQYPGYIWRISFENGQKLIKTKAFLVGDRYYSVQTVAPRKVALSKNIDRFMDTFRYKPIWPY